MPKWLNLSNCAFQDWKVGFSVRGFLDIQRVPFCYSSPRFFGMCFGLCSLVRATPWWWDASFGVGNCCKQDSSAPGILWFPANICTETGPLLIKRIFLFICVCVCVRTRTNNIENFRTPIHVLSFWDQIRMCKFLSWGAISETPVKSSPTLVSFKAR